MVWFSTWDCEHYVVCIVRVAECNCAANDRGSGRLCRKSWYHWVTNDRISTRSAVGAETAEIQDEGIGIIIVFEIAFDNGINGTDVLVENGGAS